MKKIIVNGFLLVLSIQVFSQAAVKLENLGPKVNSKYHEVRPTISADGKLLYFVVEGNPGNTKFKIKPDDAQDVWYSTLNKDGQWDSARRVETSINTRLTNTIYWVSPDGNRILTRGAYDSAAVYSGRGMSLRYKTDTGWSTPVKQKMREYDKMSLGKYSGAMMANDGKTMLLYFSEEKNSEDNDIYVSFLIDNNEWTKPLNLGPTINSIYYDEISPFLASDGKTLYFSSNRRGGLGDNDIWMSKRLDDSWTKWTEPVNMGSPINTTGWDAYFALDAAGENAYLSSTQNSIGGNDILKTQLDVDKRPEPAVILFGKVYNAKTKEVMSAKFDYESWPEGKNKGNAFSSPVDGSYKIVLPQGRKYDLRTTADKFYPITDSLDLSAIAGYTELHRDLYFTPIEELVALNPGNGNEVIYKDVHKDLDDTTSYELGDIVRLKNILYDFNKAILRSKSFPELDKLVRILKKNPTVKIELSAHTDYIGSDAYNIGLSNDRAYAAREYLISSGIAEDRIISKGFGESRPIATNKTSEGRQLNRRVEFVVIQK